jgi:hypothetical protein
VSETINISDGTATRWNDTLYIITNLVRSLRSASDGKLIILSISDTLLVLWYLLQMYRAARKALGFLKRNQKTSNQQIKTQAYQALVRPKLEYSCSIWDPHTSESIRKILMVQRRAARYICNRYHNTSSVSDMLNIINLPSLAERRLRTRLVMVL